MISAKKEAFMEKTYAFRNIHISFRKGKYADGRLGIMIISGPGTEEEEWFTDLTVNLYIDDKLDSDCAFLHVNHIPNDLMALLEKEKIFSYTGRSVKSGFVIYPECCFDKEWLDSLLPLDS